jgi:signal transduction histidine kinase
MTEDGKGAPGRKQTDDSLRTERENADDAMRAMQSEVQSEADQVLQRARDAADAVLVVAREKADERLDQAAPGASLAEERVLEDATVRDERASADDALQREREENAAALSRLLPMEREKTDRYLLTERIRSDDDLAHRDDFLGIVSHDLRNLLSGIVMTAGLLTERASASDEGAQTLEAAARIQRYAARMNRLIGDLVDVASIDGGTLSVATSRGDTSALIDEAIDMFHGLAVGKGVSLEGDVTERPLPATFDHDRLTQVLANLITNAIKFTPRGGSIVVHNERTPDGLRISVRDTGMGIPCDKLEMVFERFWQVGKNDRRGVGLGLYISRSIVQAHGGTIWAESSPGVGSTLSFILPA